MAIQYAKARFRALEAVSPRLAARLALRLFTVPRRWPAPAWELTVAQRAERIWLASGHTGLSWGRGRPVLLVHGWEGRVTQLGRFVEPLVAAGFRVIGFDASAHDAHRGKTLTVLEYAQFLRTVVAELGPLHGAIAHSMGASAVGFAARRPLRVGRAVLISIARSVGAAAQRFEDVLALGPRTRALFRRRLETEVFGAPVAELDLCRRVPAYLPPTLLLATDDDRDVPVEDTQEVAARWPKARMQIALKAGGHRKVLRDERVIDAAVRFLTEPAWLPRPLEPTALTAADAPAPAAHVRY